MRKKKSKTCNQCGEKFEYHSELETKTVNVCVNPECPNYGLLQIAAEDMPNQKGGGKDD